jgi:hypothetical protein
VSGVADRTPAAQNITFTVLDAPHLFGRKRGMMRPFGLRSPRVISPSQQVIAISLLTGRIGSSSLANEIK